MDIFNVMHRGWDGKPLSYDHLKGALRSLETWLLRRGLTADLRLVSDPHLLSKAHPQQVSKFESRIASGEIALVDDGQEADPTVLAIARRTNGLVVSDDRYKKWYRRGHEWLMFEPCRGVMPAKKPRGPWVRRCAWLALAVTAARAYRLRMSAQSQQGEPTSSESYTFVIQHNDGQPQSVTLRPQKGELNFAFGTPERRAAVWKVAVSRKGEVYIMERSTGQLLKTSLHRSGDWRVQWIAGDPTGHPDVADAIEKTGTRIIDQWERPAPKFEGYTPAFAIMTSGDQLTAADPEAVPKRDMVWLPTPAMDEIGFIMLAYMKPTGQKIELKGYLPLAAFMMDTGEVVMVMAAKRIMKADEARSLTQLRERLDEARDQLIAAGKYDDRQTRVLVVGAQSEEGIRYLVDARMSRP